MFAVLPHNVTPFYFKGSYQIKANTNWMDPTLLEPAIPFVPISRFYASILSSST